MFEKDTRRARVVSVLEQVIPARFRVSYPSRYEVLIEGENAREISEVVHEAAEGCHVKVRSSVIRVRVV